MKKVLLTTIIAGGGLVALGAGSMFFANSQVDKLVEQAQTSVTSPAQLTVVEDSNSLWQRDLTLSFRIDDSVQPVELIIENKFDKTLLGSKISHSVRLSDDVLATVDDAQLRDFMQKNLIDQPFITGETNTSMTGGYTSSLTSVNIVETFDALELKVQPIIVNVEGSLAGAMKIDGQWAGLSLATTALEALQMNVNGITFSAEGEYIDGSIFVGEQLLAGEGLTIKALSDWDQQSFVLNPYTVESIGEMESVRYQGNFKLSAEGFTLNSEGSELSVDELRLGMGIAGIDAENYKELMQGLNEMQVTGVQSEAMKTQANTFLRNGFSLSFSDWFARMGDDTFAFDGEINLPENEIADISNPFSFMGLFGSVTAKADLNMDSALAEKPELNSLLLPILMTGALVSENDQYKMQASLENGIAKLNGEPLPLPF